MSHLNANPEFLQIEFNSRIKYSQVSLAQCLFESNDTESKRWPLRMNMSEDFILTENPFGVLLLLMSGEKPRDDNATCVWSVQHKQHSTTHDEEQRKGLKKYLSTKNRSKKKLTKAETHGNSSEKKVESLYASRSKLNIDGISMPLFSVWESKGPHSPHLWVGSNWIWFSPSSFYLSCNVMSALSPICGMRN